VGSKLPTLHFFAFFAPLRETLSLAKTAKGAKKSKRRCHSELKLCHSERSEESHPFRTETLHCVQGDSPEVSRVTAAVGWAASCPPYISLRTLRSLQEILSLAEGARKIHFLIFKNSVSYISRKSASVSLGIHFSMYERYRGVALSFSRNASIFLMTFCPHSVLAHKE